MRNKQFVGISSRTKSLSINSLVAEAEVDEKYFVLIIRAGLSEQKIVCTLFVAYDEDVNAKSTVGKLYLVKEHTAWQRTGWAILHRLFRRNTQAVECFRGSQCFYGMPFPSLLGAEIFNILAILTP